MRQERRARSVPPLPGGRSPSFSSWLAPRGPCGPSPSRPKSPGSERRDRPASSFAVSHWLPTTARNTSQSLLRAQRVDIHKGVELRNEAVVDSTGVCDGIFPTIADEYSGLCFRRAVILSHSHAIRAGRSRFLCRSSSAFRNVARMLRLSHCLIAPVARYDSSS